MVAFNVNKAFNFVVKMTLCMCFSSSFLKCCSTDMRVNSSTNSFSITLTASAENKAVPWPLDSKYTPMSKCSSAALWTFFTPVFAHTVSTPFFSQNFVNAPLLYAVCAIPSDILCANPAKKSCSMRKKAIKIDSLSPSHNIKFCFFDEFSPSFPSSSSSSSIEKYTNRSQSPSTEAHL